MDAITRLRKAAKFYKADPDDLIDWYRDDLDAIAEMPSHDLAFVIEDYQAKRDWYRESTLGS